MARKKSVSVRIGQAAKEQATHLLHQLGIRKQHTNIISICTAAIRFTVGRWLMLLDKPDAAKIRDAIRRGGGEVVVGLVGYVLFLRGQAVFGEGDDGPNITIKRDDVDVITFALADVYCIGQTEGMAYLHVMSHGLITAFERLFL